MKFRSGFVSNSSSSSFCLFGKMFEFRYKEQEKFYDLFDTNSVKSFEDFKKEYIEEHEYEPGPSEYLDEILKDYDLLCYIYASEEGYVAIGGDYESAPNDMTFGSFRDLVNKELNEVLKIPVSAVHICEDYYS